MNQSEGEAPTDDLRGRTSWSRIRRFEVPEGSRKRLCPAEPTVI